MLQDDESLALALRGGLRGRFQGTFNQLENAVEVLDDYMLQHLNPAEYADLRTMMREINWQLAYLRRLGDHAADAAAAPVLQMLRVPAPLELLSQLHETVELFNELTVGGTRAVHARLETAPGLDVFPTMGDPALLDGLLVNLFTNSIQAVPEPDAVEITLTCTQNQLLYRDNGPGLPQDARRLLLEGVWTSELLAKGGLGLPLIRAYCTAMGWQISQPEGERGLLFTLPTCQAEALGTLHLSAPDTAAPGVAAACTRANSAFTFSPRRSLPTLKTIPHNSKCRYGERGAADAKPKAQIILCVLSSILATQMPCRSRRSGA